MATRIKLLTITGLASQVLLLTFLTVSSAPIEGESNRRPELQYVGLVDGKSYFVDLYRTWNRTDAEASCEASGLKMASIETQEQADMLTRRLPEMYYGGYFWTSAKESRKASMFIWNESEAPVDSLLVTSWECILMDTIV